MPNENESILLHSSFVCSDQQCRTRIQKAKTDGEQMSTGHKVIMRRGVERDATEKEACRCCGAPVVHTREYNKPTMACVAYLRDCLNVFGTALTESVTLQSHYAGLLNMHDGGQRMQFVSFVDWIKRLRETGTLPKV